MTQGVVRALVLAALALSLLAVPGPAQALPSDDDAVLVELTSMEPLNPVPGGELTFTGTIHNRSGVPVADVAVVLRISPTPLGSRSEVGVVADQSTSRVGQTVESTLTPVAEALPPSESATFTLKAATDTLPLGTTPGVYAFFIEARTSEGSFDTTIPVPWIPDPTVLQPSQVVALTQLRSPVDLSGDNRLLSPVLSASMAPGGSLNSLASASTAAAAAGLPINWLIDPAITQAAAGLADGTATFPDSVSDAQAAAAQARDWLAGVVAGATAESSNVYLTPFAEVDASAVIAAGQGDLLNQSIAAAPQVAAQSLPAADGLLAAPPSGNTTPDTLGAYAAAGVGQILMSGTALPPSQSLNYTPSGVARIPSSGGELTAVLPDAGLAGDLARPWGTPAQLFRWQQSLLADIAMITLELPTTPRTVVLAPEQGAVLPVDGYAGVLTALASAPYTRLAPLAGLMGPDVPTVPRQLNLAVDDPGRLSAEYLAPIPGIQQRLDAFARVTLDPPAFAADYEQALLRSASGQWRADPAAGASLLSTVNEELAAEEGKVTTVSTGTVTFSGNSGILPLTISNGLDQAVEVGVLLRSDPEVRLDFIPPELAIVDAGKRTSIEVQVSVYGSGPLPVSVILTDRNGEPFITTGDLVIQSRATNRAAAIVTIVGGVALFGLVLWRFVRKGSDDD